MGQVVTLKFGAQAHDFFFQPFDAHTAAQGGNVEKSVFAFWLPYLFSHSRTLQ
jgi:hypothetical protein